MFLGVRFIVHMLPRIAVNLLSTSYFHSLNKPNQRLCYDFKDRKVRPTHYSIQAHSQCLVAAFVDF
jgi:hypothetical protein